MAHSSTARATATCGTPAQRRTLPCFRHSSIQTYTRMIYHPLISTLQSQGDTAERLVQCHAGSNSKAYSGIDERVRAVAHKLLQKEEELKFITAPGRIPPKASVIAALRNDISALRKQLSDPSSSAHLLYPEAARAVESDATEKKTTAKKVVATNQALKTSGRKVQAPSSARRALLMVEEKLSAATRGASSGEKVPVSEKVKQALEMIEHNMSSMTEASKNLNEFETLQVENAMLRTKLEITLEKKRRLEKLHQAYEMGHIAPQTRSSIQTNTSTARKERVKTKNLNAVYSL